MGEKPMQAREAQVTANWIRLLVGVVALLVSWTRGEASAARPDYFAARAFGLALQTDYSRQKGQAFVNRLDGEAMKRRVFAIFGDDVMDQPEVKKLWEEQFYPSFKKQLLDFEVFPNFLVPRVLLVDGARMLECVVLDDAGRFQMLMLRLCEVNGSVWIEDVKMLGSASGLTGAARGTLLVMGVRSAVALGDEESALERLGSVYRLTTLETFSKMAEGKLDAAFVIWSGVLPKFRETTYWRSVRNRLALGGSAKAMHHLQEAIMQGEPIDSFLRFSMANTAKDTARALGALDEVLRETREPAFLRSLKAGLLLDMGRTKEALILARETSRQDPSNGLSYGVWIQAAVAIDDRLAATEGLVSWARLIPVEEIDRLVIGTPSLERVRDSAAYADWKKSTTLNPASAPIP